MDRHYADSLTQVYALQSAALQYENLSKFVNRPSSAALHSTPQSSSIRDRTLARLEQTGEEAQQGIRDCLAQMEACVEGLAQLLFEVDVFLAQPTTVLQYGLHPSQALSHVSQLHGSYQAELLAKRETFADYNAEELSLNEFVAAWKELKEVKGQHQETMDDLASAMGSWGA